VRDITSRKELELELQQANLELQLLAYLDGLTKIANRRCFDEFLSQEWRRLCRTQSPLSLLLLDIDHFKFYNDAYGHLRGDDCLAKIAEVLQNIVSRPSDLVARYGGEEFTITLPETDLEGAIIIAEAIRNAIHALEIPHETSDVSDKITVSIGITCLTPDLELPPKYLIDKADRALYQAKQQGRDRYCVECDKKNGGVMATILIVGCGAIGSELARVLMAKGHRVTGIRRRPPTASHNIDILQADINIASDLDPLSSHIDLLFFIVSADGRTEASYRQVYETGLNNVLAKFADVPCIFVSSTSVYGQSQGEWVNEEAIAQPDNFNSQLIRQAEQRVTARNPQNIVVRFSGIYGAGREYLLNRARQRPAVQQTPPSFTNRIHQDDCVQILAFLLEKKLAGIPLAQYYLASDDDPAPTYEVMSWLAEQLNCPQPTIAPADHHSTMNKRCNNQRLKALGYRFIYPSYKDGYAQLIANHKQ
jgi:diguanylate cyclase (GGDEF)-like protein